MKTLKVLFLSSITVLIITTLSVLNSSYITQKIFEYVSNKVPLSYTSLSGTLYSGITIEDLNYDDTIKIKTLFINPSILSLLFFEIYIHDMQIDTLWFDNKLLNKENSSNNSDFNIPIFIKNMDLSLYDYTYDDYHIKEFFLKSRNIKYDFSNNFSGEFDINIISNIGHFKTSLDIAKNKYNIDGYVDLDLNYINSILTTDLLNTIYFKANGDFSNIEFQLNTKQLIINNNNEKIIIDDLKSYGNYNFNTQQFNIKELQSTINYNLTKSNILMNATINNYDINSMVFDIQSNTTVNKNITKIIQKNLQLNTHISGNLSEINFKTNIDNNKILLDNLSIDIQNSNLFGNLKYDENLQTLLGTFSLSTNGAIDTINFDLNLNNIKLEHYINKDKLYLMGNMDLKSNIGNKISNFDLVLDTKIIENSTLSAKSIINNIKYKNLQLDSIDILNITTNYKQNSLSINLLSTIADISISTKNFEQYKFDINIKDLNPNSFYQLDENLKISSIKGKLIGEYNNQLLVNGNLSINDSLIIKTNVHGDLKNLHGSFLNPTFNIKFNKQDDDITIKTSTHSIKKMQQELNKILIFIPIDIDGIVDLEIYQTPLDVKFNLTTPKIIFEKNFIDKITISGHYVEDFIYFNKLNFSITDIFDINLQKDFSLKKQGHLDIKTLNSYLDFHDLVIKTSKENGNLIIKLDTKDFFIAHNSYGSGFATSMVAIDIDPHKKITISGDIHITNLTAIYQAPAMSINKDKDIIIVSKNNLQKTHDIFYDDIALELAIFADNFNYSVKNINLKASTVLYLKKSFSENIKIYGSLHDVSGSFSELGKMYNIQNSNIYFRGLEPIDPILDIHALHKLQDVDITIVIGGTLNFPRIHLHSSPIMSQKDILSFLIFGTRFSSDSPKNDQSRQSQASLFLLNELSKDYAKELGLDMLYFEYNPTTQYIETHVGKNISQKSKMVLKNKAESGQIIFMRELTKLWNVELGFEGHTQSIDLTYRKRY